MIFLNIDLLKNRLIASNFSITLGSILLRPHVYFIAFPSKYFVNSSLKINGVLDWSAKISHEFVQFNGFKWSFVQNIVVIPDFIKVLLKMCISSNSIETSVSLQNFEWSLSSLILIDDEMTRGLTILVCYLKCVIFDHFLCESITSFSKIALRDDSFIGIPPFTTLIISWEFIIRRSVAFKVR